MTIVLKPLLEVHFDLGVPVEVGDSHYGRRVFYEVTGGSFQGERIRGRVLPGGGDWLLIDAEGVARLDVRVLLETDDGARIYVSYPGILVPNDKFHAMVKRGTSIDYGDAHFLTQPHFETGDPRYRWLNQTMAVAEGRGSASWVEYRVYTLDVT